MKAPAGFCFFLLISCNAFAQEDSAGAVLPSVIIKAFEQNRKLMDVPAAISYTGKNTLARFNASSLVSALNSSAGVRMEERSPGSYRLNIRGSSLRSPFGVRNVKIYFNDVPFTDPGGQSYLNELGYYNFSSVEIIRGANNSLYGAGTGGVMLIESLPADQRAETGLDYSAGSFGYHNMHASLATATDRAVTNTGFQHQQSDGYREHSALRRDVFSWNGNFSVGANKLKTTFLYGDLFYETPGALTKTEFTANPRMARPPAGANPGAVSAHAAIRQRMLLAGISYDQLITSNLRNKTTVYAMFTELRNPAISSYGKNAEPHTGGRTVFKYSRLVDKLMIRLDGGAEIQQGFASFAIHKNVNGNPDSLRTYDELHNRQLMLFAQSSLEWRTFTFLAGASWNTLRLHFQRFTPATPGEQERKFNNEIAPRITLMKKFRQVNLYAAVSRGFSPPTTAELLPTGGAVNLGLQAEEGINYEVGMKALFKKIYVDFNAFTFHLKNTIVLRRNANGSDFYLNAGSTKQFGTETSISIPLWQSSRNIRSGTCWISHTWYDFHYREFKQLANDYSGKRLPSVAPHTLSAGADIKMKNGLLAVLNYYYSDRIALNDANSDYADNYHLAGAKVGYEKRFEKMKVVVFFGADNLLNQVYSLGNDINGFGGRYYNAAAGRNWYAGLSLQLYNKRTNDSK